MATRSAHHGGEVVPLSGLLGGLYDRISDDRRAGRGVARQDKKNRLTAKRYAVAVVDTYVDNDTPASTGEPRPAFERLLADLVAGRINAVVCWDLDRLWRLPIELERFLVLARRHGVRVFDRVGEVDVVSTRGRQNVRHMAVKSAGEVEQLSDRTKEAMDENAEAGRPHGRQAYGWRREAILDDRGNRVGHRDVVDVDQAAVVVELCERIVAGDSLRSIVADLNARAVPAPVTVWSALTVRQLVRRPRNVARRVHRGTVVGPGEWDPIVPGDLYEQALAVLADPGRRKSQSTRYQHLLSGIARCGRCQVPSMRRKRRSSRPAPAYVCDRCGLARMQEPVDAMATRLAVAWLSAPNAAELLAAATDDGSRLAAATAEAAALRARLNNLAVQASMDEIDDEQLAIMSAALRPKLRAAEQRMRTVQADSLLASAIGPDAAQEWPGWSMGRRRSIVAELLDVTVLPVGKGKRVFDPMSVDIRWKLGAPGDAAADCHSGS